MHKLNLVECSDVNTLDLKLDEEINVSSFHRQTNMQGVTRVSIDDVTGQKYRIIPPK